MKTQEINISILDDNIFFNKMLSHQIGNYTANYSKGSAFNFHIMSYLHGEDLLNNLPKENNIILLDYYLGNNKTGIDVLKGIKQKNIDAQIAVITFKDDPALFFNVKKYGANAFIPKDNDTLGRVFYFIDKTIKKEL